MKWELFSFSFMIYYARVHSINILQAYIQYMKFTRRAEGIKSARQVFKLAREDSRTRYHVFVAAALMEYYCSKASERDLFQIFCPNINSDIKSLIVN